MRGRTDLLLSIVCLMTVAPAVQASHTPEETAVRRAALDLHTDSTVIDLCDESQRSVELETVYSLQTGSILLHSTRIDYLIHESAEELSVSISPATHHIYIPLLESVRGASVAATSNLTFVADGSGEDCRPVDVVVEAFAEKNGNVASARLPYNFVVLVPARAE